MQVRLDIHWIPSLTCIISDMISYTISELNFMEPKNSICDVVLANSGCWIVVDIVPSFLILLCYCVSHKPQVQENRRELSKSAHAAAATASLGHSGVSVNGEGKGVGLVSVIDSAEARKADGVMVPAFDFERFFFQGHQNELVA